MSVVRNLCVRICQANRASLDGVRFLNMRILHRIVFFWVGRNTDIPTLLVRSIRQHLGLDMEIVQLSDRDTPRVDGVNTYRRMKLSSRIMVARLEAYASLTINKPTLFLDADMLVLRDFDLPSLNASEVGVTPRNDRAEINWRFPIDFPEFKGKYINDEMPYIYSFVYTSSEILFVRQLNRLRKLPRRFQEWYGDQVTLKHELESGRYVKRDFSIDIYNRTVNTLGEFEKILTSHPDVCLVHFKGPKGKHVMLEATRMMQRTPE